MSKRSEQRRYQKQCEKILDDAGITLTPKDRANIEIAELGLGEFDRTGLGLITYENNERYCAKELVHVSASDMPRAQAPTD